MIDVLTKNVISPVRVMLPVCQLNVNIQLQRAMRVKIIKDIVKNYNEKSIGVITVNKVNGAYRIIDGQHRVCALKTLNIHEVWCNVYYDLSDKEEAEIYKQMATSSLHSKYEKYKAELILNDDITINITNMLKTYDIEISDRKAQTKIACIDEIYKCYKINEGLLKNTIEVFQECFDLNNGISGIELKGMFLFLNKAVENPKFNFEYFKSKLKNKNQTYLIRLGATNKETSFTTPAKGYSMALLYLYNSGKMESNRLSIDFIS